MNKRRLKKAIRRITRLPLNHNLLLYTGNKVRHYFYKLTRSTLIAYPSTVMLELTNHCNLACTTCPREYTYGREMDKGSMEIDRAKRIIDELWPFLDSVGLTGMGETLIFKEIGEIADYIKLKNRGIIISVSTNAQVPGFLSKISPLVGRLDTIQISIDGLGPVYESIRRNANFETLNKNITELSSLCSHSETDLMLNMVVTKENYMQMADMVEYAAGRSVKYLDFTLFNLAAVTDIEPEYYSFYASDQFTTALQALQHAIVQYPAVEVTGKNFSTGSGFRQCPFPWTHFYISWNGYMVPCCAKPFPKLLNFGSVFDQGVYKVLNNTAYRNFRKLWQDNRTPGFCRKCHFVESTMNRALSELSEAKLET